MNVLNLWNNITAFFRNSAYWHGYDSIPQRLLEHVTYSGEALLIAAAIALPVGLITGHTGRGGNAVALVAVATRALPSYGLLVLLFVIMGLGLWPVMIPLVALAVPPILVTTYEAVHNVEGSLTDAAKGMGMRPWQVLARVEIPVALPLILSGLRSAAVQIVSTATIAAYISFGGLGRYIVDGLYQENYSEVAGGATLVAMLALATLGLFWLVGRLVVSPGLRHRDG
jgi:osmoprotectant transport system permease protein